MAKRDTRRSEDAKPAPAPEAMMKARVSQALVEAVGAPISTVRVLIQEVPKTNWGIAGVSAKDLGR